MGGELGGGGGGEEEKDSNVGTKHDFMSTCYHNIGSISMAYNFACVMLNKAHHKLKKTFKILYPRLQFKRKKKHRSTFCIVAGFGGGFFAFPCCGTNARDIVKPMQTYFKTTKRFRVLSLKSRPREQLHTLPTRFLVMNSKTAVKEIN